MELSFKGFGGEKMLAESHSKDFNDVKIDNQSGDPCHNGIICL